MERDEDPFDEFEDFLDDFLDELTSETSEFAADRVRETDQSQFDPLIDVRVYGDEVKLVAHLPGVDKEDVNVRCNGTETVIEVELPHSTAEREVQMPTSVVPESASARLHNHILTTTFGRDDYGSGK